MEMSGAPAMATSWQDEDEELKAGGAKGLGNRPRFSFSEIKMLLEQVRRNRYILLSESREGRVGGGFRFMPFVLLGREAADGASKDICDHQRQRRNANMGALFVGRPGPRKAKTCKRLTPSQLHWK